MNELALLHITDSAYCFPISENSIVIRLRTAKNDITDAWVLYESKYKIGEQHNKAVMHVTFQKADITSLDYADESFDTVVAANVIHLLDQPYKALAELNRVCKTGGKLIIPTYVNKEKTGKTGGVVNVIGKAGADFKQQFTYSNYRAFFEKAGYRDIKTTLIQGRVPCAVAIIIK